MKRLMPLLCLAALFGALAASAQEKDNESDIFGQSKPWKRLEWFYSRRAYPFNDVPPNARLLAWDQKQSMPVYAPAQIGAQAALWEFLGPNQTNQNNLGRVNALAVNPANPNIIYVGAAKGGVWKSTDGGTTWANLTDTLASQCSGCLTLEPGNPNTVYFGTGEEYFALNTLGGVGIYKSTDGGATWTLYGNFAFAGRRINQIIIDPGNVNRWIVATDAGIYITTNGGATFLQRLAGRASALRMHPTNSSILYGAIYGGAAGGVYKSTDGGSNWTLQTMNGLPNGNGFGRIELDFCKGNGNVVYAAFGSSDSHIGSIWKTTDGGVSWTQMTIPSAGAGFTWYALIMRVDPTDPLIAYCGEQTLYRTTNGGATWASVQPPHPDHHILEFHPTNPQQLYLGEDGGFYTSTNRGTNWTAKNAGRGTMEYYAFDVHPTTAGALMAGAQDNGTQQRAATTTFTHRLGGDGFWAAYKKTNGNIILGESQNGNVNRSTNGGVNWSGVFNGGTDGAGWSTPITNDPNTPNRFYVGAKHVWRSDSDGASGTWASISGDLGNGGSISIIAVSPSSSSYIATGASGAVYVSTDGGANWVNRTAGLPNRSADALAFDPTNPQILYVGLSGTGSGHVYKSLNAGATWTNISGNLPDSPMNSLVVHPNSSNMLFAANDVGVFVTTDGGATWQVFGSGFPSTPALMLRANAPTNYLSVATYGRGVWRTPLPIFPAWDINRDGSTDDADLGIVLSQQGKCQGDPGFLPAADVNGDHCVDDADLGLVLAHQGE